MADTGPGDAIELNSSFDPCDADDEEISSDDDVDCSEEEMADDPGNLVKETTVLSDSSGVEVMHPVTTSEKTTLPSVSDTGPSAKSTSPRQATHCMSNSSDSDEEEEDEEEEEEILEDEFLPADLADERPPSDEEVIEMMSEEDAFPTDFDDLSDDGEVVELFEDDSESEILKKLKASSRKDKPKTNRPEQSKNGNPMEQTKTNISVSDGPLSSASEDLPLSSFCEESAQKKSVSVLESGDKKETDPQFPKSIPTDDGDKETIAASKAEVSGQKKSKGDKPKKKRKKKVDKGAEGSGKESEVDKEKKKRKKKKLKKESGEGGDTDTKEKKQKKPRKRKKKADGESSDVEEGEEKKKKKKRKRKDTEEDGDDEENEKKRKTAFERKNIRKIKDDEMLEQVTLDAQKEEHERRQRMMEKIRMQQEKQAEEERLLMEKLEAIKNSQLKSLLEDSGSSDYEEDMLPLEHKRKPRDHQPEPSEVVTISSSEDDVVMVASDAEPEESEDDEDPENSGSHVNDELNVPDVNGKVLANVGHAADEEDVFLAPQLAMAVKPHQIGGIRFLYDNLVESLERFKESQGFGCILAHSMGLGKTLQVISFTEIFLRCTGAKKVLIIVPVNTIQNWVHEFNMWLPVDPAEQVPKAEEPPAKKKPAEKKKVKEKSKENNSKSKPKKEASRKEKKKVESKGSTSLKDGSDAPTGPPSGSTLGSTMRDCPYPPPPFPGPPPPSFMSMPGFPFSPMGQPNMDYKNYNGRPPPDFKYGGMPPMPPPHMFGSGNYGSMPPFSSSSGPMPPFSGAYQGQMPPMPSFMPGNQDRPDFKGFPNFMPPPFMGMMNMPPGACGPDIPGGYPGFNPMSGPMDMSAGNPYKPDSKDFMNYNPLDMSRHVPAPPMFKAQDNEEKDMKDFTSEPTDLSNKNDKPPFEMNQSDPHMINDEPGVRERSPMSREEKAPSKESAADNNDSAFGMKEESISIKESNESDIQSQKPSELLSDQSVSTSNNVSQPDKIPDVKVEEKQTFPDFSDLQNDSLAPDLKSNGLNSNCLNEGCLKSEMNDFNSKCTEDKTETLKETKSEEVNKEVVSMETSDTSSSQQKSPSDIKGESEFDENRTNDLPEVKSPNESKENKSETTSTEQTGHSETKDGEQDKEGSAEVNDPTANFMDTIDELFKEDTKPPEVWYRKFKVYVINDNLKTNMARAKVVADWHKGGGVLLVGYEMYRLLTSRRVLAGKTKKKRQRKKDDGESTVTKPVGKEPEVIDLEEEDKNNELLTDLQEALVKPGPDLVICDEGHRIKNSHASISQSLKSIRTKRRVVLTGYPLQNNLLEYWCMVDFVRPNYLGNKTEFCNMFERPIMNGQCVDSTPGDAKLMRFRAHVLHSLLEGFVQRRGHMVLKRALPRKQEYVLLVKMSNVQRELYREFMLTISDAGLTAWANNNPLKAFAVCCKIWNHPDVLHEVVQERKGITAAEDIDLDIEDKAALAGDATKKNKKGPTKGQSADDKATEGAPSPSSKPDSIKDKDKPATDTTENDAFPFPDKKDQNFISYDWAYSLMNDYKKGVMENGGKLVILLSILEESILCGDKILVFSQSLFTLSLIEEYLSKLKVPGEGRDEHWAKNKNYFRLDGSTSSFDREKMINQFNAENNDHIHLFLLSTRAGCLGINVIGANRVVVFDASWNPCHDCQAVCRVYRYGQSKQTVVYRLVSDNTMEKKIYDRQINKQGMSDRVVDELNPQNNYTRKHVDLLLHYEDKDLECIDPDCGDAEVDDHVLLKVIKKHNKWITKEPFTHESLLLDRKDQKLTKTEKRLAKQGYEMEKKMNISYSRPSYSAFYPKNNVGGPSIVRPPNARYTVSVNRPVASVRPMMSTPIPMRPSGYHGPMGKMGKGQQQTILRPGVSVQQIQTTTDIIIPGTATSTDSKGSRIPAGENVLVIKTPKGVYIRTSQGKIFAVRTAPKGTATSPTSTAGPRQVVTMGSQGHQHGARVVMTKGGVTTTTAGRTGPVTSILPIKPGAGASPSGGMVNTVTAAGSKTTKVTPRVSMVTTSLLHMASGSVAAKPSMKGVVRPPNNYKIIKVKVGNQNSKDGKSPTTPPTTVHTVMPIRKPTPTIIAMPRKSLLEGHKNKDFSGVVRAQKEKEKDTESTHQSDDDSVEALTLTEHSTSDEQVSPDRPVSKMDISELDTSGNVKTSSVLESTTGISSGDAGPEKKSPDNPDLDIADNTTRSSTDKKEVKGINVPSTERLPERVADMSQQETAAREQSPINSVKDSHVSSQNTLSESDNSMCDSPLDKNSVCGSNDLPQNVDLLTTAQKSNTPDKASAPQCTPSASSDFVVSKDVPNPTSSTTGMSADSKASDNPLSQPCTSPAADSSAEGPQALRQSTSKSVASGLNTGPDLSYGHGFSPAKSFGAQKSPFVPTDPQGISTENSSSQGTLFDTNPLYSSNYPQDISCGGNSSEELFGGNSSQGASFGSNSSQGTGMGTNTAQGTSGGPNSYQAMSFGPNNSQGVPSGAEYSQRTSSGSNMSQGMSFGPNSSQMSPFGPNSQFGSQLQETLFRSNPHMSSFGLKPSQGMTYGPNGSKGLSATANSPSRKPSKPNSQVISGEQNAPRRMQSVPPNPSQDGQPRPDPSMIMPPGQSFPHKMHSGKDEFLSMSSRQNFPADFETGPQNRPRGFRGPRTSQPGHFSSQTIPSEQHHYQNLSSGSQNTPDMSPGVTSEPVTSKSDPQNSSSGNTMLQDMLSSPSPSTQPGQYRAGSSHQQSMSPRQNTPQAGNMSPGQPPGKTQKDMMLGQNPQSLSFASSASPGKPRGSRKSQSKTSVPDMVPGMAYDPEAVQGKKAGTNLSQNVLSQQNPAMMRGQNLPESIPYGQKSQEMHSVQGMSQNVSSMNPSQNLVPSGNMTGQYMSQHGMAGQTPQMGYGNQPQGMSSDYPAHNINPGQSGSHPGHSVPHPGQSGSHPGHNVPHPGQSGSHPGHSAPHPGQSGSHPGHNVPHPGQSGSHPGHGAPHPGQSGSHPGHSAPHPGQSGSHPGHSAPHPGQSGSHPGHGTPHPGQSAPHPGHSAPHPGQSAPHPKHSAPHPGQSGSHPGHSSPHSGQSGLHPGHRGSHLGQSAPHPGQSGSHPGHNTAHPEQSGSHPGHRGSHLGQSASLSGHSAPHPGQTWPHPGLHGSQGAPASSQNMYMDQKISGHSVSNQDNTVGTGMYPQPGMSHGKPRPTLPRVTQAMPSSMQANSPQRMTRPDFSPTSPLPPQQGPANYGGSFSQTINPGFSPSAVPPSQNFQPEAGLMPNTPPVELTKSGKPKKPRKPREPKEPKLPKEKKPPKEKKVKEPKEKKPPKESKTKKGKTAAKQNMPSPFRPGFGPDEDMEMQMPMNPMMQHQQDPMGSQPALPHGSNMSSTGGYPTFTPHDMNSQNGNHGTPPGIEPPADTLGMLGESLLESIGVLNQGDGVPIPENDIAKSGSGYTDKSMSYNSTNNSNTVGNTGSQGPSSDAPSIPQNESQASSRTQPSAYSGQSYNNPYGYGSQQQSSWNVSSRPTWESNSMGYQQSNQDSPGKNTSNQSNVNTDYGSTSTPLAHNQPSANSMDSSNNPTFNPGMNSSNMYSNPSQGYIVGNFSSQQYPSYPYPQNNYYPPPTSHYSANPSGPEQWSGGGMLDSQSSYNPYQVSGMSTYPPTAGTPQMSYNPQTMMSQMSENPAYGFSKNYSSNQSYPQNVQQKPPEGPNSSSNLTSL